MKLGSDKLKNTSDWKDDIEEQLGRDKLTVADGELKLSKNDKNDQKVAIEKSRRFAFFLVRFWRNLSKKAPIGIYGKTGPTKSTVLGPGPPPGRKHKFYWKLTIFTVLGAFNRAGKTVTKVGIYSQPPQNWCQKPIFY
jgi:hypothetical protein